MQLNNYLQYRHVKSQQNIFQTNTKNTQAQQKTMEHLMANKIKTQVREIMYEINYIYFDDNCSRNINMSKSPSIKRSNSKSNYKRINNN